MREFLIESVYFGVLLSLATYGFGMFVKKKLKLAIFNPTLISIGIIIAILLIFNIDYQTYYQGAHYLHYLLTPTTICLAVPLYQQFELLKKNYLAVLAGILSGVLTSLSSVLAMCAIFTLSHEEYITFLPKSVTTAIGMSISQEFGGYVSITVTIILITGVLGNLFAEGVCRLFRIREKIAVGIAIGSASHALGTAKAFEIGEVEGAMSSLSIVISGLLTVGVAGIFANFM
ncbi:MAG: LrgB family protein [Clostridia bacterium]|nr:LrgB family protein [Clostridia bacterium]